MDTDTNVVEPQFQPTSEVANINIQAFVSQFGIVYDEKHSKLLNDVKVLIRAWMSGGVNKATGLDDVDSVSLNVFMMLTSMPVPADMEMDTFMDALFTYPSCITP